MQKILDHVEELVSSVPDFATQDVDGLAAEGEAGNEVDVQRCTNGASHPSLLRRGLSQVARRKSGEVEEVALRSEEGRQQPGRVSHGEACGEQFSGRIFLSSGLLQQGG